ncbi:hypothetical protein H257_18106 [Aphanomyces astaci]|uniref:Uncharacterized protein n=1 Tax=Aphanomyces astaci TaxID=112090 RepID=W4FEF5_APHAT|nr:hypothetical protein H257_18106 [Aphanomyces astaci]ETV65088.1 hypothetical protein H257_18106 [Aphanomyces astaci]|eukprot:XP_009845419.1 hypothetical protein H257_18106 [Aphanomyces astaci]
MTMLFQNCHNIFRYDSCSGPTSLADEFYNETQHCFCLWNSRLYFNQQATEVSDQFGYSLPVLYTAWTYEVCTPRRTHQEAYSNERTLSGTVKCRLTGCLWKTFLAVSACCGSVVCDLWLIQMRRAEVQRQSSSRRVERFAVRTADTAAIQYVA